MPTAPSQDLPAPPGPLQGVATAGLALFAFSALFSVTLADIGLALVVLAFVAEGRRLRGLWTEPAVRVALLFAAYVAVQSLFWYLNAPTPGYAATVARTGADWIKLLLFIPFGYWAARRPHHIPGLLLLFALGLAFGFVRKLDWGALDAGFFTRQFTDYLQPLALGLFAGVSALGLLVCRAALLAPVRRGGWRWLILPAYAALLLLMLELLMLSFSRSSWLAFAACLVLWGLLTLVQALRGRDPTQLRRGLGTLALVAALLGSAVLMNLDSLRARLGAEGNTLGQIAAGQLAQDNRSSIALRLHAWQFGTALWLERPWTGWGAGSSGYWIQDSGLTQLRDSDRWLADLHNTYLELAFQLGAVGLALFLALVWLIARDCTRACRGAGGPEPPGDRPLPCLCQLLLLAAVFLALWMLTDHRATNHDGRFFWTLLAGSAYALHLARRSAPGPERTAP